MAKNFETTKKGSGATVASCEFVVTDEEMKGGAFVPAEVEKEFLVECAKQGWEPMANARYVLECQYLMFKKGMNVKVSSYVKKQTGERS